MPYPDSIDLAPGKVDHLVHPQVWDPCLGSRSLRQRSLLLMQESLRFAWQNLTDVENDLAVQCALHMIRLGGRQLVKFQGLNDSVPTQGSQTCQREHFRCSLKNKDPGLISFASIQGLSRLHCQG